MLNKPALLLALCAAIALPLCAQNPVSPQPPTAPVDTSGRIPLYRVNVISRTTKAISYQQRGGSTKVDFVGTQIMPQVAGEATVASKPGRLEVDAKFSGLKPARTFGPEYLTYVLWAITPEGRPLNLGEVLLDKDKARLHATTDLQTFAMILTAEPYFAVTRPSDLMVAENVMRPDTKGGLHPVDTKFDLLERGQYTIDLHPAQLPSTTASPSMPLDLVEAENAVAIAKTFGAEQYAADSLTKAQQGLAQAIDAYNRRLGRTAINTPARAATQAAEDARVLAINRRQEQAAAAERQAMQQREAQARAEAQSAAQAEQLARAQAEAERARAEQAKAEAERVKAESEAAAQRAAQERQQAEEARAAALAQQQATQAEAERARLAAQQAQQAATQAQQEREQMRARLLQQLNQVLQTRDTARGLVADMPDVLFDTGKATLKPGARERLAKVAGIIMAYPDLKLRIEGHTDNVGSDEYNQVLSERRAAAVRDYLVSQGVPMNNAVAMGFGKTQPVAPNTTVSGRQRNRRVDLVVSGEAIGTNMVPPPPGAGATTTTGGVAGTTVETPASAAPPAGAPGAVGTPAGAQPVNPPPPPPR